MDFGLSWIADFVRWCVLWVPRWAVCPPTHRALKYRGGIWSSFRGQQTLEVVEVRPGLYWWWPLKTTVQVYPVERQSVNLASQSLETKDGIEMLISLSLVYVVWDLERALTKNFNVDDTVKDVGTVSAVASVTRRTRDELRAAVADGSLNAEICEAARRLLRPYGIRVKQAYLTDCARHIAIRNVGSGGLVLPEGLAHD